MTTHRLVRAFVVLLIYGATVGVAYGKVLTDDDVRVLQKKMKAADSLAVDFVQTSFKALRGKKSVRKGHALFARPDKFKWMLSTPTPVEEVRLYDGKAFYEYATDGSPARRYSATGPTANDLKGMVDLVLNFDTLLKRYDLVKAEEVGDEVQITLKPKTLGDLVGVELHLSTKDGFISYLRIDQKNKNTLTHEFSHPNRNEIPAAEFALPPGVKVTDAN